MKGVLFTVQKALPLLAEGALVIVNGSTTSIGGAANFSVYSASKAAVRNFVRSWILDLRGRNIRVNTLSPGPTRTNGLARRAGPDAASQDAMFATIAKDIPLGRVAHSDEIAAAACFLASSDASFVNGIELFVDGGYAQV